MSLVATVGIWLITLDYKTTKRVFNTNHELGH